MVDDLYMGQVTISISLPILSGELIPLQVCFYHLWKAAWDQRQRLQRLDAV